MRTFISTLDSATLHEIYVEVNCPPDALKGPSVGMSYRGLARATGTSDNTVRHFMRQRGYQPIRGAVKGSMTRRPIRLISYWHCVAYLKHLTKSPRTPPERLYPLKVLYTQLKRQGRLQPISDAP